MSNVEPFELLRQADPCPYPMGLEAPEGIVEGTLAAGRTRRRRWRVGVLGAAVVVGAAAAAAAFVSTREPAHTVSVGCYAAAGLDADTAVVALDGRTPTEACAAAWQEGAVGEGPVPELQACTLPSGGIGVFPGGAPAVCQRLGHNAAPAPSSPTTGDGITELRQALAAAGREGTCVGVDAARRIADRELRRLGLTAWQVRTDETAGRRFGPDYPCTAFSVDEPAKAVVVVPVPRTQS